MRKLLILIATVLFFAVPSFAILHIGISGGYTYSSLAELDSYWEKVKTDAQANSFGASADWQGYGNGVFGNIDLNFNLDKNLHIGARSGIQYIFPSKFTGVREIDVPPVFWIPTETDTYNILIPIEGGISYLLTFGDSAVSIKAEAYAGYGLAYNGQDTRYNGSSPFLTLYSGGGFMADVSGAIELKLLPVLTISLNGGYRWAKMSDFKNIASVSATIPGYGLITIPTNDPFNDGSGKPVAVDFTGYSVGVGINIRI